MSSQNMITIHGRLLGLCSILCMYVSLCSCKDSSYISVEQIQQTNIEILTDALPLGWEAFCEAPVDEGVMSLYSGINPSDAIIHLMTINNQSIQLPIKSLSEIRDFDINPKRKTLIYVNGFHTPDSYFSVQAHLKLLQTTRRDLNVILVDFAQNVQQLYYAVRHYASIHGYFVYKVLTVLIENGIAPQDITLAGHSVGANIAAMGASLYAAETNTSDHRVGQLVAIDPAIMCRVEDIAVQPNISSRVVVVHGECDVFSIWEQRGTIDIYPNGIGYFTKRKLQPGCESNLCSHMYAFVLFMEALIEGVMIPAVKCDTWAQFRKRSCNYEDTVAIGLKYPETAEGLYFCMTQPNPPFTFMEHGLRYRGTSTRRDNSIGSTV